MAEDPVLDESVVDATTVLVLAGGRDTAADRVCIDLLQRDDGGSPLLFATLTHPPASRIGLWDEYADADRPAGTIVVAVGPAGQGTSEGPEGVTVEHVSDPSNLTRFGVTMVEALKELKGQQPAVCVHSLSALLQYADVEQVFQFVSVLHNHFEEAGATAHVHMDPDAHDDRTLITLEQLFDAVVEVTDGDVTVR
ncbi:MAG: hypothetical protein ABEJ08_03375 [Halobacteriaceae archaeon]